MLPSSSCDQCDAWSAAEIRPGAAGKASERSADGRRFPITLCSKKTSLRDRHTFLPLKAFASKIYSNVCLYTLVNRRPDKKHLGRKRDIKQKWLFRIDENVDKIFHVNEEDEYICDGGVYIVVKKQNRARRKVHGWICCLKRIRCILRIMPNCFFFCGLQSYFMS